MQHKKGSISRSGLIIGGLVTAVVLVSTWGLVGVGQAGRQSAPQRSTAQPPPSIVPGGTPQVTIPYPSWGDGTDIEHFVPGQRWESAYQPDKWPSDRQRAYVEQLENYHPQLYAQWGKRLNQALTNRKLDRRTDLLVSAAVASMALWARPVIEDYIDQAFDAGSNANEIMEAIETSPEANGHTNHDGLGALWYVYHMREKAGKPVPVTGPPLTAKDLIPPSAWTPVLFKYQLPHPRARDLAREKFNPEEAAMERRHGEELGKLPKHLSARTQELIWMASDTAVVRWPDPLVDHHHHQALNRGSNLQEIIEVMMIGSEVVQVRLIPTSPGVVCPRRWRSWFTVSRLSAGSSLNGRRLDTSPRPSTARASRRRCSARNLACRSGSSSQTRSSASVRSTPSRRHADLCSTGFLDRWSRRRT